MAWMETLMLAVAVALVVTMICTGQSFPSPPRYRAIAANIAKQPISPLSWGDSAFAR